jgi:uncharacterized SAM-binding protein YcdF (DUF218 family)
MSQGVLVPQHEQRQIADEQFHDAMLIWDYHRMGHERRPCSAAIDLGSHDLGVATTAVVLHRAGLFPVVVFSGGNSPTTRARFPCGEGVHYREHTPSLGGANEAILVEPKAGNTGQNITFSRELLTKAGVEVQSLLLISKLYMERRSYATCRKLWPEAEVVCASESLELDDYIKSIDDEKLVVDMLVGDLQRVIEYPKLGFAVEQDVPGDVYDAYERLLGAGFDSRLIST